MDRLLVTFLASIFIWLMYLGLLFLWIIDGRVKKETALHALIASFFAWLIASIIKTIDPTVRPFLLNGKIPETIFVSNDSAFPSAHTALAFALAVTIWLHNKKLGIIYLIGAVVVGVARVVANVHFPIDIVGGAIIGTVVALAVEKLHLFDFVTKKPRTSRSNKR